VSYCSGEKERRLHRLKSSVPGTLLKRTKREIKERRVRVTEQLAHIDSIDRSVLVDTGVSKLVTRSCGRRRSLCDFAVSSNHIRASRHLVFARSLCRLRRCMLPWLPLCCRSRSLEDARPTFLALTDLTPAFDSVERPSIETGGESPR